MASGRMLILALPQYKRFEIQEAFPLANVSLAVLTVNL